MRKSQNRKKRASRLTDEAVTAALLRGRRAFQQYLLRRLGSAELAEEVLQEFSLRALAKKGALKSDESVVSWLYRLLRSALVDHLRKEHRRQRQEAAFAFDPAVAPIHQQSIWNSLEAELHAAICECLYELMPLLRPSYRDVLWRVDLLGEPRRRVAKELRISTGSLTVRLHRARHSLRAMLLRACQTCPEHGFESCSCDREAIGARARSRHRARFGATVQPT